MENSNTWLRFAVADLARVGVAFVALLYVLGFLVVGFHLYEFGVTPETWIKPQYLLAGIWCLLPALWVFAGVAIATTGVLEPWIRSSLVVPRRMRAGKYIVGAVQGVLLFVLDFAVLSTAINWLNNSGRHNAWGAGSGIAFTLFFLSLLFAACMLAVFVGLRAPPNPPEPMRADRRAMQISTGVMILVISLYVAVTYIQIFTAKVYPKIPATFGGGRPQSVVFLVDRAEQRTSPIIVDGSGTRSIPYNLLLVTETSYIVESPSKNELAVEFKQDSVRGMIVLKQ